MKTLGEFLAEKREITIHTLTSYIRQFLREQWQIMVQEHQEELAQTFDKAGEYAYGVFFRMLSQPLQEQLTQAGFLCEPAYPGDFRSASVEYWGPPEERERCLWCVVKTAKGTPLGTIVTQMFHDHTEFRIPHSPGVFALEETDAFVLVRHGQASTCRGIPNRQAMPVNLRYNARHLAMLSYCFVKRSPHVILALGLVQHGSKPSSNADDACGAYRAVPISDLCRTACRNRLGE